MSIFNISESTRSTILLLLEIVIFTGGLGVIFLRKIVYSALLLGFVFISIALLYLILNADFLAAAQVLIYVGAVNVLILFGIMLINKPESQILQIWTIGDTISIITSIGLFIVIAITIFNTPWDLLSSTDNKISNLTNTNIIGYHILTDMLLPFELLSILLLVALVGSITIAKRDDSLIS